MKTLLVLLGLCAGLTARSQTFPIGPNLARDKRVEVSSTERAGTAGRFAVDGNYTTRWSSAFADPQWIYVDLGAVYSITKVRVNWEAAYGKDFQVQFSNDAQTWTTVRTITNNTARVNLISGLSGSAQYVRIYGTARGTGYGYSIYELEVSGSNTPPSVVLTSPQAADYPKPARINIAADATDPDGAVTQVAFYANGTLLAVDATPPYAYTWNDATTGVYFITAVATDDNGATTTSFSRRVQVLSDPPVVALTSPVDNGTYSRAAPIPVVATASDPDGTVTLVEFFAGSTLLASFTAPPYAYNWTPPQAGRYFLLARATDDSGRTSSVDVAVSVVDGAPAARAAAYPNPSSGRFDLAGAAEGTTVGVTDAAGLPLAKLTVRQGGVDLGGLRPGTYYLRFANAAGEVLSARVVRE